MFTILGRGRVAASNVKMTSDSFGHGTPLALITEGQECSNDSYNFYHPRNFIRKSEKVTGANTSGGERMKERHQQ